MIHVPRRLPTMNLAALPLAALLLTALLLTTGAVPAAAATGTSTSAAYAELVRVAANGRASVRIVLGARNSSYREEDWTAGRYAEAVARQASVPTGTLTVRSGDRDLRTFTLPAASSTYGKPATIKLDVSGAAYGTSLTVVHSGDATYAPATHTVTVREAPAQLGATIESITPSGDRTFTVRGSIHVPTAASPFQASKVTIRPVGYGPGGTKLNATFPATLSGTPVRSPLGGFATRHTWVAEGVTLGFSAQAPVVVEVEAAPPYHLPPVDGGGHAVVDTLQATATVRDGVIEVTHLRGPDACDLVGFVGLVTDSKNLGARRWAPQPDGAYCRATIALPDVTGLTRIGVAMSWPSWAPTVWASLDEAVVEPTPTPTRAPAERFLNYFTSYERCTDLTRQFVAESAGEWNGQRCDTYKAAWLPLLWRGFVTYTP